MPFTASGHKTNLNFLYENVYNIIDMKFIMAVKLYITMNIEGLKSLGANVFITITVADLEEVINYTVTATRREMEKVIIETKEEVYLTRKEAADLLGKHVCTLYRWKKFQYLNPIYVGGSVRYSKTDVEKLLSK